MYEILEDRALILGPVFVIGDERLAEEDQAAHILKNSSSGVTATFAVSSYLRRPVKQTKLGER